MVDVAELPWSFACTSCNRTTLAAKATEIERQMLLASGASRPLNPPSAPASAKILTQATALSLRFGALLPAALDNDHEADCERQPKPLCMLQ